MQKIKNWIQSQKKDFKKLIIGGVGLWLYVLIANPSGIETDIGIVEAFFIGIFLTAIFINAYRFWKGAEKRIGIPTDQEFKLESDIEKKIFADLINLSQKQKLSDSQLNQWILEKLNASGFYKEEWQMHYAKERIKHVFDKE